jgi:hypothetical protein
MSFPQVQGIEQYLIDRIFFTGFRFRKIVVIEKPGTGTGFSIYLRFQ